MFTIEDARAAMKTAEIHLAVSPTIDGDGRVRISWLPGSNTYVLLHTARDGAVVSKTTHKKLESIFAVFDEKTKPPVV